MKLVQSIMILTAWTLLGSASGEGTAYQPLTGTAEETAMEASASEQPETESRTGTEPETGAEFAVGTSTEIMAGWKEGEEGETALSPKTMAVIAIITVITAILCRLKTAKM